MTMAVIGAKLRGAFTLPPRSPEAVPSPPPSAGGGADAHLQQQQQQPQQWRQTSSPSGSVHVAPSTAAAVRRLAEACAPGRGGGGDDDVGRREFPGLSLTAAVLLAEKSERRGRSARGATALVGACTALHIHLLEWLAVVAVDDGDGLDPALPAGAAAAVEGSRKRAAAGASSGTDGFLLGFARRTLLDLLFLFEKRRPAPGGARMGRRAGATRDEAEEEALSKDPSAELLCAVMDTLDGTGVGKTVSPPPHPLSCEHERACGICYSVPFVSLGCKSPLTNLLVSFR